MIVYNNIIMLKQKDIILDYIKQKELESNQANFGLTTIEIANALNMYRSNVSAIINRLVDEKLLEKKGTRPLKYSIYKGKQNVDVFESLIGYDGSLKNAVQLAKASLMYPQEKLSTLIIAPEGAGTSFLARLMYEHGLSVGLLEEGEFKKFNCRYYVYDEYEINRENRNPKGIIFIDNIDYLNEKALFKLFELIKNKKQNDIDYENIRFIFCINSDANSSLIKELSSVIPIKIELPKLSLRPKREKFDLINRFLSIEAAHSQFNIEVTGAVIRALMLYEPEDNVKGLNNDIKVACANAFTRSFVEKKSVISLYLNDFSSRVKDAYINIRTNKGDIDTFASESDVFFYDGKETRKKYSNYSEEGKLYEELEKQLTTLSDRGINEEAINNLLSSNFINLIDANKKERKISTEEISKLVDKKIIDITSEFINLCEETLHRKFKPSVFYGLALHLNALIFNNPKPVKVPEEVINDIIKNHAEEYKLANTLSIMMKKFNKDLTLDDLIIITSFIILRKEVPYPKLLYVLHGNTAEALRDVTKELCKTNNIYAYNMLLQDNINKSYEELKGLIINIDDGAGVIVIYDMGSIATMLNRISNETGITIRSIYQPITLIGIDVARKASMETDIDQVYSTVFLDSGYINNEKPRAIITLCNTGEGGAIILSDYINKYSKLGYKTFPLAISNRKDLISEVDKIRVDYNIHCCVGTYNPNLYNVPFINISDVFSIRNEDLDLLLNFESPNYTNQDYDMICDYLIESSDHLNKDNIMNYLFPFIASIKAKYNLDINQETGLIVHVAALIDHILNGERNKVKIDKKLYKEYSEDFKYINKLCDKLEKQFKIIFTDDDVMLLVKMINKI